MGNYSDMLVSSPSGYIADPYLKRWMVFVDGENFAIQAKQFAQAEKIELREGEPYKADAFVWLPGVRAKERRVLPKSEFRLQPTAVRSYYYTSICGDEPLIRQVQEDLWDLGFDPLVFKKEKGRHSKGVDIALCKDILTHAFFEHYDVAVVVTGDEDYLPVITEVKRMGRVVCLAFFSQFGLSAKLKISCDGFWDIGPQFKQAWTTSTEQETGGFATKGTR